MVHKPPLGDNVITFELNWFNACIWVPWSPSDPKKSWCTDRSNQIHKICVKKQVTLLHLLAILAVQWNHYIDLPDFFDVGWNCEYQSEMLNYKI